MNCYEPKPAALKLSEIGSVVSIPNISSYKGSVGNKLNATKF